MEFDLEKFQKETMQSGYNLLKDSNCNINQTKKHAEEVKKFFQTYSINNSLNNQFYSQLLTGSSVIRLAALDIIEKQLPDSAIEYLFQSMENEINPGIRQRIITLIDKLETKHNATLYQQSNISVVNTIRMATREF